MRVRRGEERQEGRGVLWVSDLCRRVEVKRGTPSMQRGGGACGKAAESEASMRESGGEHA